MREDRTRRVRCGSGEARTQVKVGDLVRRKGGSGGHGLVVGFVGGDEQHVLVRWSESAVFPNPMREHADGLEIVRPARGGVS